MQKECYLNFLEKPGASPVLADALIRLEKQVKDSGERFFWGNEILGALSSLLSTCFQQRLKGLRRHEAAFQAFANLVKIAAGFGDRVAIAIQERLASQRDL